MATDASAAASLSTPPQPSGETEKRSWESSDDDGKGTKGRPALKLRRIPHVSPTGGYPRESSFTGTGSDSFTGKGPDSFTGKGSHSFAGKGSEDSFTGTGKGTDSFTGKGSEDSFTGKGSNSFTGKGTDNSFTGKGSEDSFTGEGTEESFTGEGTEDGFASLEEWRNELFELLALAPVRGEQLLHEMKKVWVEHRHRLMEWH